MFGATGAVVFQVEEFELTTVYYGTNSEIRVTSLGISENAPELSIMVMELSENEGIDYEISVYHPDCPQHPAWLAVCNQAMPGGGARPRHFGWVLVFAEVENVVPPDRVLDVMVVLCGHADLLRANVG